MKRCKNKKMIRAEDNKREDVKMRSKNDPTIREEMRR
jgi:hypothetical protein